MKKISFLVAAASLFALAPLTDRLGPAGGSVALVWLGVLLAVMASGSIQSLAIGTGALGALGWGVLAPISPSVAGAVLLLGAFAERTTRVRSRTARAVHVLSSLVGGALAGALATAFANGAPSVLAVAVVVAAILAAIPLLVEADDPVAHALEQAASLVDGAAKRSLLDGAELRRHAGEIPLDRKALARVKTTWASLLRLAEARVRLERSRPEALLRLATVTAAPIEGPPSLSDTTKPISAADAVLGMVDQRIAEHVTVLARTYSAIDTVSAARIGVDDTALKSAESMGESLDDVSRALLEVRAD